eukprot:6091218-Pleurochrysis_carterae.AAC.3
MQLALPALRRAPRTAGIPGASACARAACVIPVFLRGPALSERRRTQRECRHARALGRARARGACAQASPG